MNQSISRRKLIGSLAALPVALALSGCGAVDSDQQTADARVAVVIDRTRSFQENLAAAAAIVARFIRENALAGDSEVYLISLDNCPHVEQYYRAGEILDSKGNNILNEIKSPNPLGGTDVVRALDLAAWKLAKDTGVVVDRRILLFFSDMYVDPATPREREGLLKKFDWARLKQVECHFYFVAPDKERLLVDLLQEAGVRAEVLDPTESRRIVAQDVVDRRS